MRSTLFRLALGAALSVALSPVALAAPVDDARRLSQEGLAAAREGEFETALDRFMTAQDIFPHPNTLYNIGRVYFDMGDLEGALENFELFKSAAPEHAELVDPMIQVIEARLEQAAEARVAEGGGSVSASTLERLEGLITELDALKSELEVAPPAPGGEGAFAAPDGEGGFLEDAYQRQVVSASRFAQSALDSPSTISVVTREDIEMSGATHVPDLLRRVAGVGVMSLSAAQPDVSIRGFNREMSNKVLVLVDGRTIYWDLWGTALWSTLDIGLVDIERVEVIRGPAAAVYGANAVTGVINIITRGPDETKRVFRTELGTPGYSQHSALFSGRVGRTSYRMSAGYHQAGRWSMEHPVADSDEAWLVDEDPSQAMRAFRANARVDQRILDKGLLSLQGGYNEGTTHFYPWGALGRYSLPYATGYARADAAYAGFHLRTYYNTIRAAGPYPTFPGGKPVDEALESDVLDIELTTDQEFTTGAVEHRLTAGIGYRYKGVVWGYLEGDARIDEDHFNIFLQEQAHFGDWTAVLSMRADRHPLVPMDKTLSPRGALIWRVAPDSALRLSAGTAFRTPNFMESYLDFDQYTGTDAVYVHTLGDTELVPERIATAEVGFHDESTDYHSIDVVGYVSRFQDEIFISSMSPLVEPYHSESSGFVAGENGFENLDTEYTALGVEVEGRIYPLSGLDLTGAITLQEIRRDDGDGEVEVDRSTSALQANLGAAYRTPLHTDLSVHLHYLSDQVWGLPGFDAQGNLVIDEQGIPARAILSARIATRPLLDNRLEVAVSGWNLLPLLGGDPFQEHPKGQFVDSRIFATVSLDL